MPTSRRKLRPSGEKGIPEGMIRQPDPVYPANDVYENIADLIERVAVILSNRELSE
jgi:hypothetical protein